MNMKNALFALVLLPIDSACYFFPLKLDELYNATKCFKENFEVQNTLLPQESPPSQDINSRQFDHSNTNSLLSLKPLHPNPCTTPMPQNEYIEEFIKKNGRRLDWQDRQRKKEARQGHERSEFAQKVHGLKAKLYHQKRHSEKVQLKKSLKVHDQKDAKKQNADQVHDGAVPAYLLDRSTEQRAKILSNAIKEKRKEKAGKWAVPIPSVRAVAEDEIFKVIKTGKRKTKSWKRMITKATFVGEGFTRKPPKYEKFIRPMGLRFRKAHVTHPELKATFNLPIIGVKKNPQSPMYTQLGILTKGTVIEVNVSELGLVTTGGKVVWGKYAQITNNPENDGCINAVLLV